MVAFLFHTIFYSGTFISFLSLSSIFFFSLPTYFHLHYYCAARTCMELTLSQHQLLRNHLRWSARIFLIPCQIECMCDQNRARFIVPSERLTLIKRWIITTATNIKNNPTNQKVNTERERKKNLL